MHAHGILIRMINRVPREALTPQEAEALRARVQSEGVSEVARALGVDVRTLFKACAGVSVHRLTARVLRASRI